MVIASTTLKGQVVIPAKEIIEPDRVLMTGGREFMPLKDDLQIHWL